MIGELDAQSIALTAILKGQWQRFLSQSNDWGSLLQAAEREGIMPLLYAAIRRDRMGSQLPPEFITHLEGAYRRAQVSYVARYKVLRDVLGRLAEVGIQVIVFKGAALAELVYRDASLRSMCDLDFLVRTDDVFRVLQVLQEGGYVPFKNCELRPGFDLQFHVEKELVSPNNVLCVEIHWRLIGPLFACRFVDETSLWKNAREMQLVGCPAWVLAPEEWVLQLAAHAIYKHRQLRLINLCDIDRSIRTFGETLDWQQMLEIGAAFHWMPALVDVLSQAVRLLETPVPLGVLEDAACYRLPAPEQWLMAWWQKPGRPEIYHVFPDWLTLPSLRTRVYFLWAYLFPSSSYLTARYPEWGAWQRRFLYLKQLRRRTAVD